MNSPCAMLITPIWPKMMARPSAVMRGGTPPRARTCRGGTRSLVALRVRVGLHEVGGLVDQVVLTVGFGASDARLAPQVMVLVDAHVAFRRALELDAGRRGCDLVDVERAGFLDGELPQPRPEISGLGDVADHGLVAPHLVERLDEALVVRVVERLEVLHAGIGAD